MLTNVEKNSSKKYETNDGSEFLLKFEMQFTNFVHFDLWDDTLTCRMKIEN